MEPSPDEEADEEADMVVFQRGDTVVTVLDTHTTPSHPVRVERLITMALTISVQLNRAAHGVGPEGTSVPPVHMVVVLAETVEIMPLVEVLAGMAATIITLAVLAVLAVPVPAAIPILSGTFWESATGC